MKVKWKGGDKFSPKYGKLTKGREIDVLEHHGKSMVDSGRAELINKLKSTTKEY